MRRTYIVNNILSSPYAYNSETNLGEKRDVKVFDYNWVGGAICRSPRLVWK